MEVRRRRFSEMVDEDHPTVRHCCCFYGWIIWLVVTVGQMSTFYGTSSGVTFVLDDVMAELSLSRSLASLSYASGTFIGAAAQVPIGRAVDKYGGRKSVAVCSAAYFLSLSAMSLPHDWYSLTIAFVAMRSLGFGGLSMACTTCLQQWFVRRRGLATGLSESINTLFGFGFNSQLYALAVSSYGWRTSYLFVGAILLLYSPIAALLLRSHPEDIGLKPDGDDAQVRDHSESESAPSNVKKKAAPATDRDWTLRQARGTTSLWIIVAANALQWGIGAGLFFHLASIVSELGLPVALLPSCFYLPWAIARATSLVVGGYLLDKAPPRVIMFVGFLLGGLSMLALGMPGTSLTATKTVATAASWGLSMGLGKATFAVCPAMFFGRAHLGSIQGLLQTSNVASTAVGPLIVGIVHDQCRDYSPIVLAIGIINILVGAVGALFLRAPTRSSEDNLDKATSSREARCVEMCAAREASPESSAA